MIHWLKYMKGFHSTTLLTEGYRSLDKAEYQQVEVARVIMVRQAGRKTRLQEGATLRGDMEE